MRSEVVLKNVIFVSTFGGTALLRTYQWRYKIMHGLQDQFKVHDKTTDFNVTKYNYGSRIHIATHL